jgi:PAS domain S-box-containing protein
MTTLRNDSDPQSHRASSIALASVPRASERVTNAELLEALGVAVYMTDAAGVITDYNEAAALLWGRRPELGKDEWCGSWHLYWPDGTPMAHGECPMAITLKENRPVRGAEAIAERPDGSRVWFVPYPTPLRDGDGTLVGAVNVLVDITDRKTSEQALRDNEGRLTEALAAKDEFLGLISHELKTPITVIRGNARVLTTRAMKVDDAEREAALNDIASESERLHAIIDDLLVLARAANSQQLEFEPVLLHRVADTCLREFRRKHPARTFAFTSDGAEPIINADETYVRQVITNLLSNAVKYSPYNSTVELIIEPDDDSVSLHVLDSGRGIGEEEAEKIFDSFYRSPSAAGLASGVGVGLAVCKRLVEAMGGTVFAKIRPGGGADVGFSLPALAASD